MLLNSDGKDELNEVEIEASQGDGGLGEAEVDLVSIGEAGAGKEKK